ncbi:MAG: iron dependent repressor, metal binding and dimerization domain protein [Bacillota bacterium]|nr:iron dependent repressor, metal binding and dimerization domain protein [Bacillota bacterium]
MNSTQNSDFRTVRGYQLKNLKERQLTPAMEDYLEMAYKLCIKNNYTRVGKISELLNVKPSSASKMISKLAAIGFLRYDRYEIILLTDKGREFGAGLVNRHDTVEQFLKLLGMDDTLEETELIEHTLSQGTVSEIHTLLEFFRQNEVLQKNFEAFRKSKKN